jgi:hypothetical protein
LPRHVTNVHILLSAHSVHVFKVMLDSFVCLMEGKKLWPPVHMFQKKDAISHVLAVACQTQQAIDVVCAALVFDLVGLVFDERDSPTGGELNLPDELLHSAELGAKVICALRTVARSPARERCQLLRGVRRRRFGMHCRLRRSGEGHSGFARRCARVGMRQNEARRSQSLRRQGVCFGALRGVVVFPARFDFRGC